MGRVWATGQPRGLLPLGLEALDILRIESGLIFAGYEFDDQVDPFEAGIGFAVALADDEDFIGRDALLERKAHPQRRLVGLELEGNETAGHGDEVYVGRQRVGRGHERHAQPDAEALDRAVPDDASSTRSSASEVEVGKLDGLQKRIPARGRTLPVLRPRRRTRPRS